MRKALFAALVAAACYPGEAAAGYRFAVLGCAHLGACPREAFLKGLEKVRAARPDFVLTLGGMTDASEGSREDCGVLGSLSRETGAPVYSAGGPCSYSAKPASGLKCAGAGGRFEAVRLGRLTLLLLRADREEELYSDAALAWLKRELAAPSTGPVIVASHFSPWIYGGLPPANSGLPRRLTDSGEWMRKVHPLLKGRVSSVFGSGEHFLSRSEKDGVLYLTSGAPACPGPGGGAAHFLMASSGPGGEHFSVIPYGPGPAAPDTEADRMSDRFDALFLESRSLLLARAIVSPEAKAEESLGRLLEAMELEGAASVLDIGAGNGYYALRFAGKVGGSGRVYATEVDPGLVADISAAAAAAGIGNLEAVLVSERGLDPFYASRTFDRVFMGGVYLHLADPAAYFRSLRPFVKGRIIISIPESNLSPRFDDTAEFGNFKAAVQALRREPWLVSELALDRETRAFLASWNGGNVPFKVRLALMSALMKAWRGRSLPAAALEALKARHGGLKEALEAFSAGSPEEDKKSGVFLLARFREAQAAGAVFDDEFLLTLNRLLIRFFLGLPASHSDGLEGLIIRGASPRSAEVVRTLEEAGFRFVREHDVVPSVDFLEFR